LQLICFHCLCVVPYLIQLLHSQNAQNKMFFDMIFVVRSHEDYTTDTERNFMDQPTPHFPRAVMLPFPLHFVIYFLSSSYFAQKNVRSNNLCWLKGHIFKPERTGKVHIRMTTGSPKHHYPLHLWLLSVA
jgi:hypothetical protein